MVVVGVVIYCTACGDMMALVVLLLMGVILEVVWMHLTFPLMLCGQCDSLQLVTLLLW